MNPRSAISWSTSRPRVLGVALLVLIATAFVLMSASAAIGVTPTVIAPDGRSIWSYQDLADATEKYEGGYAEFDTGATGGDGLADDYTDPHGGYDTATNKCKICHAVHRAEGAYYLLRADSQDDACDYCHIGGSAHSSKQVYDLNSAGKHTPNGHTIGASSEIPDSSVAQWTEAVTLTTTGATGTPVVETIQVRAYDEQKRSMYRFARHHGHSAPSGAARRGYVAIGPLALRCMNCHQVHNAEAQTWRTLSMAAMDNTGRYTGATMTGYKLLKQFPSGTFVGGPDSYGQIPLTNISIVPETTLTAGVNFDTVRAEGADPTDITLRGQTYNKPMWVAQNLSRQGGGPGERSNSAAVNNAALSVWCADCHNLNIGGSMLLEQTELGFKAHTERTHAAPFVGAFSGPGQCYSCHRSDLPPVNSGNPCSRCHYGTGDYRENRYDTTWFEYVESDFPHSGEDGGFKLFGSYSVDLNTGAIVDAAVGPGNIDAVCIRCHNMDETYHAEGDGHAVPAAYAACQTCHVGADVTEIHADAPDGCDSCHSGSTLSSDCGTCHADRLIDHGYNAAQHTATPGSDWITLFAEREHDDAAVGASEVYVACTTCHRTELGPVHADQCSTCHPAPYNTLSGGWTGGCQQGGCHTTYHDGWRTAHWSVESQCEKCHGQSWSVTASSCANCHAAYNPADTTAPITTSNAVGSYTGPAVISFSITDSGKVGVGTTYYRIDGGTVRTGSTVTVTSAGSHTLEFWSVDQNGNVETTHRFATFTVIEDTTPPVTTSNAQATYYTNANITLSATDNSARGVKATYYRLDGGAVQTGTSVFVPAVAGTVAHVLEFWSEDWSGNVEPPKTVNFTITSGTGTIRLVWGDADIVPLNDPNADAYWTVYRGVIGGPVVASGWGAWPAWDGVDDVVVPVGSTVYAVDVWWYNTDFDDYDNTIFNNVVVSTPGQLIRLSY